MTDYYLAEFAEPAGPSEREPSWAVEADRELERTVEREVLGHDELVEAAPQILRRLERGFDDDLVWLAAVAGQPAPDAPTGRHGLPLLPLYAGPQDAEPGKLLGNALLDLPLRDNTHSAYLFAAVAPEARRRGLGTVLFDRMEQIAAEAGRSVWMTWASEPAPAPGTAVLAPTTGVGVVAADAPRTRFNAGRGYVLEQVERHSQLELPVDPALLDRLWSDALPHADGYRLVTWLGRTPIERYPDMIALHRAMSTDAPAGGVDYREEAWDDERIRQADDRAEAVGRAKITAAMEHVESGRLVAYSDVYLPGDKPCVFQGDTLVMQQHRGHRLGWLVKIAVLRELWRLDPHRTRLHTWNAGENNWMLAINETLGFYPASAQGAWQKRVELPE